MRKLVFVGAACFLACSARGRENTASEADTVHPVGTLVDYYVASPAWPEAQLPDAANCSVSFSVAGGATTFLPTTPAGTPTIQVGLPTQGLATAVLSCSLTGYPLSLLQVTGAGTQADPFAIHGIGRIDVRNVDVIYPDGTHHDCSGGSALVSPGPFTLGTDAGVFVAAGSYTVSASCVTPEGVPIRDTQTLTVQPAPDVPVGPVPDAGTDSSSPPAWPAGTCAVDSATFSDGADSCEYTATFTCGLPALTHPPASSCAITLRDCHDICKRDSHFFSCAFATSTCTPGPEAPTPNPAGPAQVICRTCPRL
jgi:hypothetical protein